MSSPGSEFFLDTRYSWKMFRGTRLQRNTIPACISWWVSTDGDGLGVGGNVEWKRCCIEAGVGKCIVQGKHERTLVVVVLKSRNLSQRRRLTYGCLGLWGDSVHLEDSNQHVDQQSSNDENNENRGKNATAIVVFRFASDSPELSVREKVQRV